MEILIYEYINEDDVVKVGTLKLSGPLILDYPIENDNEVVSKEYVDTKLVSINADNLVEGTIPDKALPVLEGRVHSTETNRTRLTLSNSPIPPGTYPVIQVDSKGLALTGRSLTENDIPNLSFSKISVTPSSLSGYGITDGVQLSNGVIEGSLELSKDPEVPSEAATKGYASSVLSNTNTESPLDIGDMISYPLGRDYPNGFLRCNGATVSKDTYSDLYSVIGDTFTTRNRSSNSGVMYLNSPWVNQSEFNDTTGIPETTDSASFSGFFNFFNGKSSNRSTCSCVWHSSNLTPSKLAYSASIIVKNRAYIIGGYNRRFRDTIYSAPIRQDGTIGNWVTELNKLPGYNATGALVAIKNKLYLIGGYGTSAQATVNPDGSISSWTKLEHDLPTTIRFPAAITTSSRVYMIGGRIGRYSSSNIYYATYNDEGELSEWSQFRLSLPIATYGHTLEMIGNKIYLLGGYIRTNRRYSYNDKVYSTTVNSNGEIGAWREEPVSLPYGVARHMSISTSSRIRIIGGRGRSWRYRNNAITGILDEEGNITSWTVEYNVLPENIESGVVLITSSKLYLINGYSGRYTNRSYFTEYTGGFNSYYSTSRTDSIPDDMFSLPDFTDIEEGDEFYLIKAE